MNNIELITKYSTKAWDKIYKAESRSSLLDAPDANVQWTGAKTVKIAKFQAGGLKNYYRNNNGDNRVPQVPGSGTSFAHQGVGFGYQMSNVGLTWEEFTVKMDRGASYPIELFDNEETDGLTLGAATTEISRVVMIPEVDAYCFSTLASYCSEASATGVKLADGSTVNGLGNLVKVAADKTNALATLNDALLYFDEHEVPAEDQIIFVSAKYFNYLRNDNTELARYLMQADYNKNVKFTLTEYEGRQIVVVPPQRFRTAFTTITDSGDGYAFGYWDATAGEAVVSEEINFIICAKSAVMHVVKYNKVKILSGDVVLAGGGFDGYMLFARVYHDVFVQDNKRYAIYTCLNNGTDKKVITAATSTVPAKKVKTAENTLVE